MTAELRRSLVLAGTGLVAGFALVLALFWGGDFVKRQVGTGTSPAPVAAIPAAPSGQPDTARKEGAGTGTKVAEEAAGDQPGKSKLAGEQIPAPAAPAPTAAKAPPSAPPAAEAKSPTFDIIRVEPNGDTVIAGRGAPNTTVEMLRNGEPIARALIDPSGQFAIVPPALPPGNSEITLRITAADGQVRRSKESVDVVVSRNRDAKPLIAMSAPDKPTVVLSQPDPVAPPPVKTASGAEPGAPAASKEQSRDQPGRSSAGAPPAAQPVKVVSVDAEEGGRLYVTGQAAPGATVRLYLNDTLVAPGSAGTDGRLAFTIGKGVTPGKYRVRIDEVDSVSGKVKTRSEVAFAVPPLATSPPAAKPSVPVAALNPKEGAAKGGEAQTSPPANASEAKDREAQAAKASPAGNASDPKAAGPDFLAAGQAPVAAAPPAALSNAAPSQSAAAGTERPGAPERSVFVPEIGTAKIVRGENLWQISRRVYGQGARYTVIFDANQGQIRNPDLIYPGQIFVVPPGGSADGRAVEKRG